MVQNPPDRRHWWGDPTSIHSTNRGSAASAPCLAGRETSLFAISGVGSRRQADAFLKAPPQAEPDSCLSHLSCMVRTADHALLDRQVEPFTSFSGCDFIEAKVSVVRLFSINELRLEKLPF